MRMNPWGVLFLSPALLAAGCITPRVTVGNASDVGTREVQNLQRVVSRDTGCPVDDVYAQPVSDRVWRVTGCDVRSEYSIAPRTFGGRRWTPVVAVDVRASNELACPSESLVVEPVGSEERRVSGCGRSARYQLSCTSNTCDWTLIESEAD